MWCYYLILGCFIYGWIGISLSETVLNSSDDVENVSEVKENQDPHVDHNSDGYIHFSIQVDPNYPRDYYLHSLRYSDDESYSKEVLDTLLISPTTGQRDLDEVQTNSHVVDINKVFRLLPDFEDQMNKIVYVRNFHQIGLIYPIRKEVALTFYDAGAKFPDRNPNPDEEIYATYLAGSIYEGLEPNSDPLPTDMSHAAKNKEHIWNKVQELSPTDYPPRTIIEVGTFMGTAAIHTWAPFVNRHSSGEGLVICVDTWLGDINMRLGSHARPFMRLQRGFPRLYELFLQNVVNHNLTDTIFPLSLSSLSAARMLGMLNWQIDLIYLDSAHQSGETLSELILYYKLLKPGGILMGDDLQDFPGVRRDFYLFIQLYSSEQFIWIVDGDEYYIIKPNNSRLLN